MFGVRAFYDRMEFIAEYYLVKIGRQTRDETGAVSTETAVLTAALVAIATAGGVILINKMTSNANAIPDTAPKPVAGG
jgi:Flp pilus assembly pilin Flp